MLVVASFVFLINTAVRMTMAIKLSTGINTSVFFFFFLFVCCFFSQLFFVHNDSRMTITFYGLDAARMNNFMCLDQAVLIFWLSFEVDFICLIIS